MLIQADARAIPLSDGSVDSIVTDPPYGLSFMGKAWDRGVPGVPFWIEALRVAKPGCHLLAFGGTRTFHRLACAIEDAEWEIRDTIMWVYGQGFPKSMNVSKAIDKEAGADRPVISVEKRSDIRGGNYHGGCEQRPALEWKRTSAASAAWNGWGTALKPAWEPIIVARKPLEGTVAANVLKHGTGAINVDGCRVKWAGPEDAAAAAAATGFADSRARDTAQQSFSIGRESRDGVNRYDPAQLQGRWPANFIHDGSEEALRLFPETAPAKKSWRGSRPHYNGKRMEDLSQRGHDDPGGSVARFFYTAKASQSDRGNEHAGPLPLFGDGEHKWRNEHPTVKPTSLMCYLCRLVTPPLGLVLDPFCGSGSTGVAAIAEGFRFVGLDLSLPHLRDIAARRIKTDRGFAL